MYSDWPPAAEYNQGFMACQARDVPVKQDDTIIKPYEERANI
jgi:hypothetical protein